MATHDFSELERMRNVINQLDAELVAILGRRMDICRTISSYKTQHNIPLMQPARIEQVKTRCEALAQKQALDLIFINQLYDLIIKETCRVEAELMGELHER